MSSKLFRSRYKNLFKRKIFFSQELKKSLFISFCLAKNKKTSLNISILLYGLLSQPTSLSTRLLLKVIELSRKSSTSSLEQIHTRIHELTTTIKEENLSKIDKEKPFLTPEVREILKQSIRSSLKKNKKISVVTTKDLLFELVVRDSIRNLLYEIAQ